MKLTGKVKAGKLAWSSEAELAIALRQIGEGNPFEAELEKPKKTRTPRANSRYWTVLVPLVRHTINEHRMHQGLPPLPKTEAVKQEIHAALVRKHIGVIDTPIGPIRETTHDKDSKRFWRFTEDVTLWLREQGWEIDGDERPPDGPAEATA